MYSEDKEKYYDVPILLLMFNRPNETLKVLKKIIEQNPKTLYVACDGAREHLPSEAKTVAQLRKQVKLEVKDIPNVKFLFREKNLGCKNAVSNAITWFFSNVEHGIIIEDDCLPNASFFRFSKDMLEKYSSNHSISMISGDNRFSEFIDFGQRYTVSPVAHVWGWATWRRVWQQYDADISSFDLTVGDKVFKTANSKRFWRRVFLNTAKNKIDTWDHQLTHLLMKTRSYCIIPPVNLVENIGFGENATHTVMSNEFSKTLAARPYSPPYEGDLRLNSKINMELEKRYQIKLFSISRVTKFIKRNLGIPK